MRVFKSGGGAMIRSFGVTSGAAACANTEKKNRKKMDFGTDFHYESDSIFGRSNGVSACH